MSPWERGSVVPVAIEYPRKIANLPTTMKSCCLVLVFLGAAEAAVQIPPVMTTTQIKVFVRLGAQARTSYVVGITVHLIKIYL